VLTTLGLGFALLGIVLIAPNVQGGLGALSWSSLASLDTGSDQLSVAFVLLLAGLAAKIGWAPHNFPDAQAPPLPRRLPERLLAVLVVARRPQARYVGATSHGVVVRSLLAVCVPFCGATRLGACHCLGAHGQPGPRFAFTKPLAMAGVIVHVVATRSLASVLPRRRLCAAPPRRRAATGSAAHARRLQGISLGSPVCPFRLRERC
jgi:hypothetical protein